MHSHPMRRADRKLTEEQAFAILDAGEYGVLSTADAGGEPYGVPLTYARAGDALYFHCSNAGGRKVSNLENNPRACFTVVTKHRIVPERLTCDFCSVVLSGSVRFVTDDEEKMRAVRHLVAKYADDHQAEAEAVIERSFGKVSVLAFSIEEISGKAAMLPDSQEQPSRLPHAPVRA